MAMTKGNRYLDSLKTSAKEGLQAVERRPAVGARFSRCWHHRQGRINVKVARGLAC